MTEGKLKTDDEMLKRKTAHICASHLYILVGCAGMGLVATWWFERL